jgi:predicted nucleotidyltransferase component of viral defense system
MKTIHPFSHRCGAEVLVYSPTELFTGKMRALFGRVRKRDLHNVWQIPKLGLMFLALLTRSSGLKGLTIIFDELVRRKDRRLGENALKLDEGLPNFDVLFDDQVSWWYE